MLAKVCWTWRLIALSMPQLWNDIQLLKFYPTGLRRRFINSVWLLDTYRQCWRHGTLKLPFEHFYRFSSESTPIFECVPTMLNTAVIIAFSIITYAQTPLLRQQSTSCPFGPFPLAWHQLSILKLSACLCQGPKLAHCCCEITESRAEGPVPPPLHHLQCLALSGAAPCTVLSYTAMPVLEDLRIVGRSLVMEEFAWIPSFLGRSGLPLEVAVTEALTISAIMSLLSVDSCLPQLQDMMFQHHQILDKNMNSMFYVIAEVIADRVSSTPRLLQLFRLTMMHEETEPTTQVRQILRGTVERGIKLDISSHYARWL
ncbi:F-box domain-containing protein [Favolaschia claudopus]|uniref:F-box domain-containing protein n=1 Tax=Favolaschia claudopus TaxID=2862362 RepID=A0AAW0DWF8_9AGAR